MAVTDELRGWAEEFWEFAYGYFGDKAKLLEIADRIDAEHKRVMAESIIDMTDESMAEHGWYRALCADGKPMLLGDAMEWCNGTFTIHELRFTEDGCTTWDSEHGYIVHADECRHYHKPTVEDVLREFGDWYAHTKGGCDEDGIVADYAAKLREMLAGDEE